MQYTSFHGLKISRLCLGTVQLGKEYGIANKVGKPSISTAFSIMERAIGRGINVFDTAANYGESEAIIGKLIQEKKIRDFFVISKIPKVPTLIRTEQDVKAFINQQLDHSLVSLNLKELPFCLLHGSSDLIEHEGILIRILEELKTEGKVRHLGISVYTEEEVRSFLKYEELDVIQVPFNIFDQKLLHNGLLRKIHEKKAFIMARSVFLQGLFFLNPQDVKNRIPGAVEPLKKLRDLADKTGISIESLALGYVKSIPEISTILFGAETPDQVTQNIDTFNNVNLPIDLTNAIRDIFQNIPIEVTNPSLWSKPPSMTKS